MKIYLNREPVSGPWGGGNKTLTSLSNFITSQGCDVVYSLGHRDIDLIFCFDPRPNNKGEWYQTFLDYRLAKNNTKIIQRVGDIGTHSKPELTQLVIQSVQLSDHVIFPSRWARDSIGYGNSNCSIIINRPLPDFFLNRNNKIEREEKPLRVVTHHWSTNPKKGFDLYSQFSNYCQNNSQYEFSYIGRVPDGLDTSCFTEYIEPCDTKMLCDILPQYDVYLTASLEEAGANHVLEAIACGLPVAYHAAGGSIPEYCSEYGIQYHDYTTMIDSVARLDNLYSFYKKRVELYNKNMNDTIKDYWNLICNIV